MNPCKCGYLGDEAKSCKKAPICGRDYQAKISGPLLDRMDIIIEVPQIDIFAEISPAKENSKIVALRIKKARLIQENRYEKEEQMNDLAQKLNSSANGKILEKYTEIDVESRNILKQSIERMGISIRGYNRILRVSRTIADLDGSQNIEKIHLIEAISYRRGLVAF
jgi:magnesium chelatase family protein